METSASEITQQNNEDNAQSRISDTSSNQIYPPLSSNVNTELLVVKSQLDASRQIVTALRNEKEIMLKHQLELETLMQKLQSELESVRKELTVSRDSESCTSNKLSDTQRELIEIHQQLLETTKLLKQAEENAQSLSLNPPTNDTTPEPCQQCEKYKQQLAIAEEKCEETEKRLGEQIQRMAGREAALEDQLAEHTSTQDEALHNAQQRIAELEETYKKQAEIDAQEHEAQLAQLRREAEEAIQNSQKEAQQELETLKEQLLNAEEREKELQNQLDEKTLENDDLKKQLESVKKNSLAESRVLVGRIKKIEQQKGVYNYFLFIFSFI